MIIGNNYQPNPRKNFENSNFNRNPLNQNNSSNANTGKIPNNQNNFSNNLLTKDISAFKYTNPENKNDMYDKSLAMLHERLKNNTITLEEFNRKCQELARRRNN